MMGDFRSYSKRDYSHITDWVFLPNPLYRDQCDHVWVSEFIGIDKQFHRVEKRCERFAKFQNGDVLLCGLHTPGYGRKGPRSVLRDLSKADLAKAQNAINEVRNLAKLLSSPVTERKDLK